MARHKKKLTGKEKFAALAKATPIWQRACDRPEEETRKVIQPLLDYWAAQRKLAERVVPGYDHADGSEVPTWNGEKTSINYLRMAAAVRKATGLSFEEFNLTTPAEELALLRIVGEVQTAERKTIEDAARCVLEQNLSKQKENAAPVCRLEVYKGFVTFDGNTIPLEVTVERLPVLLFILTDLISHPGIWRSGSDMATDANIVMDGRRIRRYLEPLPAQICNLIESSPRKGYRLKESAWCK